MTKTISGLKEEIEVSNFFAKLGYFTRFHIQLYPREGKISDIDVFCIKFDNHLLPTRNIIETKRNDDRASAVFQLYGLKTFFENCNAFFVNSKTSSRTFKITSKLNIKVYSFKRLKALSKKDQKYFSYDLEEKQGRILVNYLYVIKKQVNESLFWNYHQLWLEKDPYLKLNKIQEMFKLTDDLYDKSSDSYAFLWFRKELFLMAFLSIMEIASNCIELDNKNINQFIENKFYNLGLSKDKKMQLKEGVDALLKIIKAKSKEDRDLKLDIIPNWLPLLSKVVKQIVYNAQYANNYFLANEQVLRSNIIGKPANIRELTKNIFTQKILPSINSDLLKILHKEHILPDFQDFV